MDGATGGGPPSPPADARVRVPRAPATLVPRPRLEARLAQSGDRLLTLLAAPAGYGKTVLLSSWLLGDSRPARYAWLSLTGDDNDPRRLYADVLAALAASDPPLGRDAIAALRAPPRGSYDDFSRLLASILDELAEPLVIVFDDAQVLSSRELLERVGWFLRFPLRHLSLVAATRSDLPLPLSRLRLDGSLAELRADDLAFTVPEAQTLLAGLGIELRDDVAERLLARAEGWPAGLRLAALSLERAGDPAAFVDGFAGDDRSVADYLISEVLARLDTPTRDFLMRTSIADELTGPLADALTDRGDGQRTLAALERDNVLITALYSRGGAYRYHGLFAELLRNELRFRAPQDLPLLHRRAAEFNAAHDRPLEAIRHAIEGECWDLAAEEAVGAWPRLLMDGRASELRPLLDRLPRDLVARRPELALVCAEERLELSDLAGADAYIALARAGEGDSAERSDCAAVWAAVEVRRAALGGAPASVSPHTRELLTGADGGDPRRRLLALRDLGLLDALAGNLDAAERETRAALALARAGGHDYAQAGCLSLLAALAVARFRLAAASELAGEALQIAGPAGWSRLPALAWAHLALAMCHLSRNAPDRARLDLEPAAAAAGVSGDASIGLAVCAVAARARALAGDHLEIHGLLDRVRELRGELGDPDHAPVIPVDLDALEVRLLLTLGELDEARGLLAGLGRRDGGLSGRCLLMKARLELAEDEPAAAHATLAEFESRPAPDDVAPIDAAVLRAIASAAERDDRAALAALERALDGAEPEGYDAPFVEASARLRPLLEQALRAGTRHRAMVGELLDGGRSGAHDRSSVAELLEPLSDREKTVLRFLPTELSNAEIANELFVSVNTVKTHLRSIYRKLDVARRHEAVQRARDLRLLAPGLAERRRVAG